MTASHIDSITPAIPLKRVGDPDEIAGLVGAKVYQEKVSGARTDRAELAKLLRRIEAGDLLIVTRLDRLARSARDLLNILHQLAEKGAKFKSLHDPWCDTSTPQG
jgi:DNA invertase Pin-like site-specific DNA recombinase